MLKAQFLERWKQLNRPLPLRPRPVRYKHEGSTYAEDGIRITGSQAWIDAVLSRLKDLLEFENTETRLQMVYKESTDRVTHGAIGSFNCYIQVHERGDEAKMVNAFASSLAGKQTILSRGY